MSKRVALYARVSTDQQATGLEAQVRVLKEYCAHNKIEDFELYTDENVSGTKNSRPALDRMMAAVTEREISSVVVYSFSRFARSTTHLLSALEKFKKHGVNFVSLTEKIDTNSPLGLAIFTILGAVATLERDLIAERVRNGLANARAKGKHIGRAKLRDSELIRKLLKAKVTYRRIAEIAKCSHGSVHAEVVAVRKELAEGKRKKEEEQKRIDELVSLSKKFPELEKSETQVKPGTDSVPPKTESPA